MKKGKESKNLGENYRIVRRIGQGADGEVYLVLHIPTDQFRAAKCIQSVASGDRRHELKMMKGLRHPALPIIYDVIENAGQFWLIMEYISGRALTLVQNEEITDTFFWDIALQLAGVLAYLHSRASPVLHLDIKPSNIILRDDGRIILFDFGAAVFCAKGTKVKALFATKGFAAPEQEAKQSVDTSADVYSFGRTLHYLLYRKPGQKQEQVRQKSKKTDGWQKYASMLIDECTRHEVQNRIHDGKLLLERVEHYKRKSRGRSMMTALFAASSLLIVCCFLAVNVLLAKITPDGEHRINKEYQRLLSMAGGVGDEFAAQHYLEAAMLQPEDPLWAEQLLARISQDGIFSQEEEAIWLQTIYDIPAGWSETLFERLAKNKTAYADITYTLGITYWYCYQGIGGKAAAVNWLKQSIDASGNSGSKDKRTIARLHLKLAHYETRYEESGARSSVYVKEAWHDLSELWKQNLRMQLPSYMQEGIAEELLSCILLNAAVLREAGIEKAAVIQILRDIKDILMREQKGELLASYYAAMRAAERAYSQKE